MSSGHMVATPGQLLLRRTRRFGWIAVLASTVLLIPVAYQPTDSATQSPGPLLSLVMAIVLLGVCASYRGVAAYLRTEDRRDNELAVARRDGVTLAVNTVRHHIGNKLSVTVGYSEMLADDLRLPRDVQEQANKVLTSALAAAEVVDKLAEQLIRVELDTSVAGPALLDVDASTRAS